MNTPEFNWLAQYVLAVITTAAGGRLRIKVEEVNALPLGYLLIDRLPDDTINCTFHPSERGEVIADLCALGLAILTHQNGDALVVKPKELAKQPNGTFGHVFVGEDIEFLFVQGAVTLQ